jgi:MATE family multidrug resistance protein
MHKNTAPIITRLLAALKPEVKPSIANSFRDELNFTLRLAVPLALGELGWMSTYIVDALMVGRLSQSALAISASSLGNTIFYALAFCVVGLLTSLETLTAQAYGRGDTNASLKMLAQSLWFVAVATPLVMVLTLAAIPLLKYCGTPPDIIAETNVYLRALVWSTAPLLLYWAFRRYLQSIDRVLLIMLSLITASIVNFIGDWAFLFGHLNLKPQGIAGSAWATCVVRAYTLTFLVVAVSRVSADAQSKWSWNLFRPDWQRLGLLFRLGWPAAIQSLADLGVSTFLSLLCARLGATLLAAHQVVLDLNAVVYMVPLGFSYATITRVGQASGRRNAKQIRRAAAVNLLVVICFIVVAAILFVSFPRFWASLYTNDVAAVSAAAPIFILCGLLQVGDAAGIVLTGALVGLGDTRTPFWIDVASSWLLGMPLAYWLAFHANLGLSGLWIGRLVAAMSGGLLLAIFWGFRVRNLRSHPVAFLQPASAPMLRAKAAEVSR